MLPGFSILAQPVEDISYQHASLKILEEIVQMNMVILVQQPNFYIGPHVEFKSLTIGSILINIKATLCEATRTGLNH